MARGDLFSPREATASGTLSLFLASDSLLYAPSFLEDVRTVCRDITFVHLNIASSGPRDINRMFFFENVASQKRYDLSYASDNHRIVLSAPANANLLYLRRPTEVGSFTGWSQKELVAACNRSKSMIVK
jgi:hypothetical protein